MVKKQTQQENSTSGYRKVSSGSFPSNWDYKKMPVLEGKVESKKKVPFKRGKKTEEIFVVSIADKESGEIFAVWESAALATFCEEVKPGQMAKVEFKGVKKLKGKKTLKQFDAYIAE